MKNLDTLWPLIVPFATAMGKLWWDYRTMLAVQRHEYEMKRLELQNRKD